MGAPSHPGRLPQVPATTPPVLSICPVADTPIPAGRASVPHAARNSAAVRSTVVRIGVRYPSKLTLRSVRASTAPSSSTSPSLTAVPPMSMPR